MSCGYNSYASQIYSGVDWIPFIVPLAISAAAWTFTPTGKDGHMKPAKQLILIFFGLWLLLMELFVYMAQVYANVQRPDPYCLELVMVYAFPSRISFYLATLVTYLFMFAYLWNAEIHWLYWTCTLLFFVAPQAMLVWMVQNTWQEALISTLIGVISTIVFMVFYRFFVIDVTPYLVQQRPWTWFSAADTWTMTRKQQEDSLRIQAILKRVECRV